MVDTSPLSVRAYQSHSQANQWEEIWEAGPYYDRLSLLLEEARNYAIFVGWQIDSRLQLHGPRPGQCEPLKEKMLRICEERPDFHFYFLIWDHAYFYVLERESWQGRIWENLHPRIHFIFDNRHPFGGSHHEKICILDGKVALCGGIDICDDRWDSPEHRYFDPRRSLDGQQEKHGPYHDLAVQVRGPICARIHEHVAERWRVTSSVPFPAPPPLLLHRENGSGPNPNDEGHSVYFSRTLASIDAGTRGPSLIREIEFLFRDLIRKARHRIVLEGQYYWSREINDLLISKIHEMKDQDFEIILVLAELTGIRSLTRKMACYEMSLLEQLHEAARHAGVRLTMGTPWVHPPAGHPGLGPKPVYIHSKLLIIDDHYLCVGSANFASRALRVDTEVSLTLEARDSEERRHIQEVGDQVLHHWNIESATIRTLSALSHDSDIRLRPFQSRLDLAHRSQKRWFNHPWHTDIPYQLFFDPIVPWPYRFKHRFRSLSKRRPWVIALSLISLWLFGAWLALLLSEGAGGGVNQPQGLAHWPAVYSILLSSVWLLPIPFLPTAILACMHLGVEPASRLAVSALWVASFYGYSLARMFPTTAARYYNRIGPSWLPERIGRRSFETLISVLSDPRVELRSKIAYQGLCCVPLPWFILGTWIVLPAAMYLGCRWVAELAPTLLLAHVHTHPIRWIAVIFALTACRAVMRVFKTVNLPGALPLEGNLSRDETIKKSA